MLRLSACGLLLLATGLAALPPFAHATPLPSAPVGTAPRQWIEQSHLIAPHRVGSYRWQSTQFDADTPAVGAGFDYRHADHPDIDINVFVHPAGTADIEAALASGMAEFRTLLQEEQQFGVATEVLEQAPLNLPRPAAGVPRALTRLAPAKDIPGHRFLMTQTVEGKRLHSASYLFYRSLYLYKVHVRAPEASMSRGDFSRRADDAARRLVPAIEVLNIGTCGNIQDLPAHILELPPQGVQEEFLATLAAQQLALQANNCSDRLDPQQLREKSRDAEIVEINYPANSWSEQ